MATSGLVAGQHAAGAEGGTHLGLHSPAWGLRHCVPGKCTRAEEVAAHMPGLDACFSFGMFSPAWWLLHTCCSVWHQQQVCPWALLWVLWAAQSRCDVCRQCECMRGCCVDVLCAAGRRQPVGTAGVAVPGDTKGENKVTRMMPSCDMQHAWNTRTWVLLGAKPSKPITPNAAVKPAPSRAIAV